jgi:hypothetical protein
MQERFEKRQITAAVQDASRVNGRESLRQLLPRKLSGLPLLPGNKKCGVNFYGGE